MFGRMIKSCQLLVYIYDIGENESTTFNLISAKTVIFREKSYRNEFVENLFVYIFYPYTFYPSDAPFWRKNSKY